jgi:hypothetical protein
MHVTIDHLDKREIEQKGWFGRTKTVVISGHWVKLCVELSESERATVIQRNISDAVITKIPNPRYDTEYKGYLFMLELSNKPVHPDSYVGRHPEKHVRPEPPDRMVPVTLAMFCDRDGFYRVFETPGEAKNWAVELRKHLQALKQLIDHNTGLGTTETFDL